MIEINLLPKNLRKKSPMIAIDKNIINSFFIIFGTIFLFVHILIGGVFLLKKNSLNNLNSTLIKISQDLKDINQIKDEIKKLQADDTKITGLMKDRFSMAKILNDLSLNLPGGIWFRYLKWIDSDFEIEGSVVSLNAEEMAILNKYLTTLKADNEIPIFAKLELVDAKKRVFQGIELIDFSIKAKAK